MLSLITAVTTKGVIGNNGELPWKLYNDLRYFKKLTKGHIVLMGRKTFESIGGPLKNRINVVLSRSFDGVSYSAAENYSILRFPNYKLALDSINKLNPNLNVFVIGGAQIYKECLDYQLPDDLYITRIYHDFKGDTYLPEIPYKYYNLVSLEERKENDITYDFEVWKLL